MKGNLGNLMRQAQQMQQKLARMQEKMAAETAEGQAGGGMVTAVVNGKHALISIKIEKDVINPDDADMLQDLIVSAVNQANTNMADRMQEEMSKITGGMNVPGLNGLF